MNDPGRPIIAQWPDSEITRQISDLKARIDGIRADQEPERARIAREQQVLREQTAAFDRVLAPIVEKYGDLLQERFRASEYAKQPGEHWTEYHERLRALNINQPKQDE